MPVFGSLDDILIIQDVVYFNLKVHETLYFSEHFNAYVVVDSTEYTIIHHNNLFSFIPLYARKIKGLTTHHQKAILLKHHIS